MSRTIFYQESQIMEQSSPPNLATQCSTASIILTDEYNSFSNSIGQRFIGFIQRKFSQKHQEEKRDFVDLTQLE